MMALKYQEGISIADHVSKFQSVMNQLLGMSVKFDDEILGLWLLATLPDSWETFRVSLINSAPQGIITLDLATSGVLNEEVRRRSQGSTSQSEKGHIKKYCFKLKRENKGGGDKHDWNDEEKSERVGAVTREDLLGNDGLVSVTGMGDASLASTSRDTVNVTVNDSSTELWHKRLSRIRKQRRVSFSSRPPHRKSELLELVHSDICGPIKDDVQGDVNDDQQDIGEFDAPKDDFVTDQQQAPIAPTTVPLRRSSRDRRSSIKYSSDDYVLLTDEGEPECYEEAMESESKDQWVEAMKDELQSLHDNHTFELVKLPKGVIGRERISMLASA
ncbi:hypothetical protein V6N12_068668 [Hibiscus sabdariffa]|uniref:Retrovirus-related Pol polyprotein from transposon TNT 1-94 n=1 Tax=Hibiscus sabdariffa TaxID=183260 RepID=A0ABR2FQP0_9ROSI